MKAAREAPARPALALPPPPAPSGAWAGGGAQRGAQQARLTHQSKLSRPEGEAPSTPRYLCSGILPVTCPGPLRQTATGGGRPLQSEAGEEGKGKGRRKGGQFLVSASSRLLLPKPASEVTGPGR